MRLIRIVVSALLLVAGSALAFACTTPEVGAPCMPEQIPETGFNSAEAYVETSSVQCETRVCLVYQMDGIPNCTPEQQARADSPGGGCAADDEDCVPTVCAPDEDVRDRVYCSCRCEAPSADFAKCDCPAGYKCEEVLEEGGPGVQGSYCVNARTVN